MQSRISCFDKTVFKKNLTRFAPVLAVYTLCLILGMTILYMDSRNANERVSFWFAHYMGQCIQIMGLVNLFYAPLLAMLLFGDLYNSRMCNALHAMPLRRETWFMTNLVSGLVFSLLPTAVMMVLSIPLLNGTVVHNAWQIALLWFVGSNLEFVCFFGIAVFAAMCTGSRFAMGTVYAALNGGAFVIYNIISTVYTPMLYGVITPERLCLLLTPIANMVDDVFVEVQSWNELAHLFTNRESEMVANFWVNENFYNLIAYAVAGLVFMVIALVLYQKRDLECAGDAVAFRKLEPVFQIACGVGGAALAVLFVQMFLSSIYRNNVALVYIFLLCGLIVGWFAGKMLIERSIRVFRLKNWRGLAALAAIAVVTLGMTYFDVFGIEDWTPRAEKVKSVGFGNNNGYTVEITEKEDIEKIIRLQEMALEDRLETYNGFPLSYVQSRNGVEGITMPSGEGFYYGEGGYDRYEEHLYSAPVYITYQMESGKTVQRSYYIWSSLTEGEIAKEFLSDWDLVWQYARMGWYDAFDLDDIREIRVDGAEVPKELNSVENAQSLLDAIKADCEAGNMTQNEYFHHGYFRVPNPDYEKNKEGKEYYRRSSISVTIYTGDGEDYNYTAADFDVFVDSENTLNWLKDHGLLAYETVEETGYLAYQ